MVFSLPVQIIIFVTVDTGFREFQLYAHEPRPNIWNPYENKNNG